MAAAGVYADFDPKRNPNGGPSSRIGFPGQTFNPTNLPTGASPSPNFINQNNLYGASVQQNAEDYDSIMGGYRNILNNPSNPIQYNPYQYQASPEYTSATSRLSGLADTGGYSEQNKQDIRARGMSPIRSIYAGANRDINRGRALQGGYSPNYNASKVKMAREMSDLISGKMSDVNAGLAERIAQNRIGTTSQLANLAGQESAMQNQFGQRNAEMGLDLAKYNQQQPIQQKMGALQGMSSMYGTTPALANLFGSQALSWAQLNNNKPQQRTNIPNFLSNIWRQ